MRERYSRKRIKSGFGERYGICLFVETEAQKKASGVEPSERRRGLKRSESSHPELVRPIFSRVNRSVHTVEYNLAICVVTVDRI